MALPTQVTDPFVKKTVHAPTAQQHGVQFLAPILDRLIRKAATVTDHLGLPGIVINADQHIGATSLLLPIFLTEQVSQQDRGCMCGIVDHPYSHRNAALYPRYRFRRQVAYITTQQAQLHIVDFIHLHQSRKRFWTWGESSGLFFN